LQAPNEFTNPSHMPGMLIGRCPKNPSSLRLMLDQIDQLGHVAVRLNLRQQVEGLIKGQVAGQVLFNPLGYLSPRRLHA